MKKSVPLHQICKGKSIMKPSNNNNNYTEQMDVDHMSNGEEATQKFILFNQLGSGEEAKKKSVPPYQICKGKNIMEPSNNNTQMDANQAMGIQFQEEIIMEILSKLPVRSLLQFKCVSKFWNILISDPYFEKKHLIHAKNDLNSHKFLINYYWPKDRIYSIYCCTLSSVQLVEDVQELPFPSSPQSWHSVIHCCCDGLVIIQVTYNSDCKHSLLLLWNPSTRESIVLPNPEFPLNGDSLLGLGYDSTSGGYKILKVRTGINGHKVGSEILSLKSGSWRNIDKHPRGISNVLRGVHSLAFIHDTFHWIGIFGKYSGIPRNYSLVSYSISNEVYGEIPLPRQTLCLRGNIIFGVSVLEGMLCVHCSSIQQEETFKLWVLKDYGVKESWKALLIIKEPWICNIIPKYRFANGDLLFWCIDSQCRGNAFRTCSGPFVSWPRGGIQHGFAFTESLISPKLLIY